ncbi:MAG: hypothetical protein ABI683_05660 [Ginsengibacter sp.]
MKKNNQVLRLFFTVCITAVFFSCNSGTETKTDETTMSNDSATAAATDTMASTPAAAQPALAAPFDIVVIDQVVKDYGTWRPFFISDSTARQASGLKDIVVSKNMDKPNDISVILLATDVSKAKAFGADSRLKDVMQKAGVVGKPEINYWHVLRFNPDAKAKQWVTVTHKVKDFDTWQKAFDAEGTATRAEHGLVDALLARGIDDPNMVFIAMDLADMDKAKARIKDPAFKKIMTDAGVIGAPKIVFNSGME